MCKELKKLNIQEKKQRDLEKYRGTKLNDLKRSPNRQEILRIMFNIPSHQGNADYLRFHLITVRMVISETYMTGNVHKIMDEITNAHGNGRVVALRS